MTTMNEGPSSSKGEEAEESGYDTESSDEETVEVTRERFEELIDNHATAETVKQVIDQDPPYQGIPVSRSEPDYSETGYVSTVPKQIPNEDGNNREANETSQEDISSKIKKDVQVFRRSALWAAIGSFTVLIAVASFWSVGMISVTTTAFLAGLLLLTSSLFLKIWYDVSE